MKYLPLLLLLPIQDVDFRTVNDFAVQLKDVDLKALGDAKHDLLVIDHSRDFPAGSTYVPTDYEGLRKSAGGPKLVFAYLSIGVAQSTRYYWQKEWNTTPPAFLGQKDPNRHDSYHVKFWDPAWQSIIVGQKESYIDRLIDNGFDGVVLDAIDSYAYWQNQGVEDARTKMIEWMNNLGIYCRKRTAKFHLVAWGGEHLLADGRFLASINGFLQTNVYLSAGTRRSDADYRKSEEALDRATKEGKKVLIVEFTEVQADADWIFARAKEKSYIATCAPAALNKIVTLPGHEPD